MHLFPNVSRTTLDSFHRDVYRPRLALLVLVVLLIVSDQERRMGRTDTDGIAQLALKSPHLDNAFQAGNQEKQRLSIVGALGGRVNALMDRLPLRSDLAVVSAKRRRQHEERRETSSKGKKPDKKIRRKEQPEKVISSKERKLRSHSRTSPSRSLLAKVLDADAMSVIVSLHALWLIRLSSMLVEDTVGKENFDHARQTLLLSTSIFNRTNISVLIWLTLSVALAFFSVIFSWAGMLNRWGLARQEPAIESMTSVRSIVFIELLITLFSLVSPLTRFKHSAFSRWIPSKVTIPSPSHSPALIDLLPIPSALLEAFKTRDTSTSATLRSRHRNANVAGRTLLPIPVSPIRRHGDLTGAAAFMDLQERERQQHEQSQHEQGERQQVRQRTVNANIAQRGSQPSSLISEPLHLPNSGKAPRVRGIYVRVETCWLMENAVMFFGHLAGVLQYMIVALSLPTLAPTSFPSLLSLLSLRAELGAVAATWSSSRRSLECLEFVRRRWTTGIRPSDALNLTSVEGEGAVCAICFERVASTFSRSDEREDACTLDCGHQLHAICLVQWLTKQAFCPCCHSALKATPPNMPAMLRHRSSGTIAEVVNNS